MPELPAHSYSHKRLASLGTNHEASKDLILADFEG
jgi:hypothetical protein